VEQVETLDAIADEWRALATPSGRGIFATWEWADAWWRAFGDGRELELRACRDDAGRLVAVLPLYVARVRGLTLLRFLGHGPGDELGPVYPKGEHERTAAALTLVLRDARWDVFAGEQLPGDEGWPALLGGRRWRTEANPVLYVPERGWDDFLAGRSANFRQQLSRRERSLARAGRARFRLANEATLERDLDTLFALHAARWRGRRSDFSDVPFHRDVARRALSRGWLRLWLLELDDRPVAVWHGFHVGRIVSYYQAGRDPAFEREAVGAILLAHTVREAMADGAAEYRFGRGDEAFKYRFADEDVGLDTVVLAANARGRVARRIARLGHHARGLAHRRDARR
jgi:CelD/BcsL family acetyltransferase involved in cellulose biosynthesis